MIEQDLDLAGAEKRLIHAVTTLETNHGPDYADLSKAKNNLGLVQRERGARDEARSNFERARKIAETNQDHSIAAQALVHLAEMSMADGKVAAAKEELDRALTHFPEDNQQGWRFGLYQGALAEWQTATCQLQDAGATLDKSNHALSARWSWPNLFRRANERRRAQLTTMQNNDTARCRGAAPYVPAKS
jgi:Tfp pilus assembly protein PilF